MDSQQSSRRLFTIISCGVLAVAIVLLCSFKIMDRDFWWHITAGKVMWESGKLIVTDPFAFTRAGLPYLATHEWLAQVILFLAHRFGGATGIILFRTVMMLATIGLLLLIDRRHLFPNALIAIISAAAVLPGFLERPQLFTFLIFSGQLLLACRYLRPGMELRQRVGLLLALILLDVVWWNVHGAAALVGVGLVGALFLERLIPAWAEQRLNRDRILQKELALLLLGCVASLLALFATPSGGETLQYLSLLLTDKTIAFISEWQPRSTGYVLFMGPLWALAILSLFRTRRNVVFSVLLLGAMGYLSVRSLRHEMLFVLAATAVCFHQLQADAAWSGWIDRLIRRPIHAILVTLVLLLPIGAFARHSYRQMVVRDNLSGYGVFAPAAGAAEFIAQEDIGGNMFNTYGIGGYLIHRFFPERTVFIDGRNVDYGYDFMEAAFLAGHTAKEWSSLSDRYGITFALIDYDAIKQPQWLSYSHILDNDPSWPMVFIDDWTAVYLKDLPINAAAIERNRYQILTAEGLEFGWVLERTPKDRLNDLEGELRRAIAGSPGSVKARILLAKLLIDEGKIDEALLIADDIATARPNRPEAFALRGAAFLVRNDVVSAADAFRHVLRFAGSEYPDLNRAFIADVFERAGWEWQASWQRWKAGTGSGLSRDPASSGTGNIGNPEVLSGSALPPGLPMTDSGSSLPDSIGNLFQETQNLIRESNDKGITFAENGDRTKAREFFMKALMLDPGNPQTCNNLAALSIQEGEYSQAIDYLNRALDRDPEFADAELNMAIALWKTGKVEDAVLHGEKAKNLGNGRADELLRFIEEH